MLLPTHTKLPNRRLYMLLVALTFVVSISAAFYTYHVVDRHNRLQITDRTDSIAATIPAPRIRQLTGTPADLDNQYYQELKTLLINLRAVNHDARFIYLVGRNPDGQLFFYADSEDPNSPDYSPPGQLYPEAPASMYTAFNTSHNGTDGPTRDRWGVWVSGYSPIVGKGGKTLALVGLDIPGNQYLTNNFVYSSLAFLITFMLMIGIITVHYNRRKERYYFEQKTEFLSIAAHEIRTPLIGIKWVLEDLLSNQKDKFDAGTVSIVSLAASNAARLLERLNSLLTTTRLEGSNKPELHKEVFTPKLLLEDIISNLSLTAKGRGVSVVLDDKGAPDAKLNGDRENLRYAFSNLISNAIKYTQPNTTVTVTIVDTEKSLGIKVTDQGLGIAPDEQKKIFEGFHRADAAVASGQPGTGIGLYLTKKIIELHKGTIEVISHQGTGSIFICTFPH